MCEALIRLRSTSGRQLGAASIVALRNESTGEAGVVDGGVPGAGDEDDGGFGDGGEEVPRDVGCWLEEFEFGGAGWEGVVVVVGDFLVVFIVFIV